MTPFRYDEEILHFPSDLPFQGVRRVRWSLGSLRCLRDLRCDPSDFRCGRRISVTRQLEPLGRLDLSDPGTLEYTRRGTVHCSRDRSFVALTLTVSSPCTSRRSVLFLSLLDDLLLHRPFILSSLLLFLVVPINCSSVLPPPPRHHH